MPRIHIETPVSAPPERVFDLALDVDAHQASAAGTGERAIAGVTSGRMTLGDTVTWEARHFGLRLHLTAKITGYDRPHEFSDAQTEGPFARMSHRHVFREVAGGCVMIDDFDFRSPLGPLGWIADALFVRRHLEKFLRARGLSEAASRGRISMTPRIGIVTLGVEDLERALRFYRDGLGWKPSSASVGDIAFFQTGGVVLALYPRAALAEDSLQSPAGSGFRGVTLAHNVRLKEEVDAVIAEAKAAGATILKPAQDAFWGGRSGYFADPDGHAWEVAWNPHFPMDASGAIVLPV